MVISETSLAIDGDCSTNKKFLNLQSCAAFIIGLIIASPVVVILSNQNNLVYAAQVDPVYKVQSGLVASDTLTSGDMSGWELNGSAVGLNANHAGSEDASGMHIGVLAPSANNWAGYFAISPLTPAHLFHAKITLPEARPLSGMVDDAVYVQQEMFQDPRIDAMGCGADIYPTEIHWTVSLQAGDATHETINRSVYSDNSPNQPSSRDCTLVTNGDNQLVAYMDGRKVFSSTNMNLNMPQPFQYYLELQTNSIQPSTGQSIFTGTFTDYYATTSDSIKVTNAGTGSIVRVVNATSGAILVTSIAGSDGIAFIDVGMYHMPINANVQVFDSTGTNLLASTTTPAGIYGGDVFSIGSTTAEQATLTINSVGLDGSPITGLYTTVTRGTAILATGFTPFQFLGNQDATYIITVNNYDTHIFDHWDGGSRISGRLVTPTTSAVTLTASYRDSGTTPAPPTSLTSLTPYTTNSNMPTITGNGQPGFSIQLYDGGRQQTPIGSPVVVPSAGLWSVSSPSPLSDGLHFIAAKATDTSGNLSPASSHITMTIDTIAPSVSIESSTISPDDRQVTLTGRTSDAGSGVRIVEVEIDNLPTTISAATPNAVGDWSTWTFTTSSGQLSPGVHHLTARATDDAGNQNLSSVDVTIPNYNSQPSQSTITVNSIDTASTALTGLYTTLSQNGAVIATGFTPTNFAVNSGQTYVVSISDYGTNYFDHWQGATDSNRDTTVTGTTAITSLTAIYRHTALPPSPPGQSTITVNSIDTANSVLTGLYTTLSQNGAVIKTGFTPVTFAVDSSPTYTISISDYGTNYFDHWDDTGSTIRDRTVDPQSSTTSTITAVYRHTPLPTAPPGQSTITVNSIDTANSVLTGLYTTLSQNGAVIATGFTPTNFAVNSGQTYVVSISDYGTNYFDHWQGATDSNRDTTVTAANSNIDLIALYRHTP